MNRDFFGNSFLSRAIVFAVILTVGYIGISQKRWNNENKVVFWDVRSYYAYLPSIVLHGDPSFEFVDKYPDVYGDKFWLEEAENGNKFVITPMGMAVLYFPFFVIGHLVALMTSFASTGYSPPYYAALLIGSLFYLSLGLFCLRKILLRYFSDQVVAVSLALVFFGTNLLYYSTFEATMSHSYSFALFSFFVYFTLKWHDTPSFKYSAILGAIYGLIVLVRPTNGVVALFFIFYNIKSIKELGQKAVYFSQNLKYLLVLSILAFVVVFPQLAYWKYITGSWILNSYGDKGAFFFNNPQIINGLFSFRKGLFVYVPLMLFAFISFPLLIRKEELKPFFIPITIFTVINLYVVLSWWVWWYGGSYGLRPLIESYALMIFPLAAGIDYVQKVKRKTLVFYRILFVVLLIHGILGNVRYYYGAIHYDSMSRGAYFETFFSVKPKGNFYNLLEPPDYTKPSQRFDKVFCDAEIIDSSKSLFVSTMPGMYFDGTQSVTSEKAFSGQQSVKLNAENQFAFTFRVPEVFAKRIFRISVKRYSEYDNGYLVVQAGANIELLYITKNYGEKIGDSGWVEIVIDVTIPETMHAHPLHVYCYNPYENDVFFDDIMIERLY
jgi:hypothetical protein